MRYTTHRTTTRVGAALPLAYQDGPPVVYQFVTVAKLVIPDLVAGDLVHLDGFCQVALGVEDPSRVMHGGYLKVTMTGDNTPTEPLILRRPMVVNFAQAQKYSIHAVAGRFVAGGAFVGSVTVLMVNYAANLSRVFDDPNNLTVNYVDLSADVHHIVGDVATTPITDD